MFRLGVQKAKNVGARHASPSILTVILQVSIVALPAGRGMPRPYVGLLHPNSERLLMRTYFKNGVQHDRLEAEKRAGSAL